jgi:hypothetical protein
MTQHPWTLWQWTQHKAIHAIYNALLWCHNHLIQYACKRQLWDEPTIATLELG